MNIHEVIELRDTPPGETVLVRVNNLAQDPGYVGYCFYPERGLGIGTVQLLNPEEASTPLEAIAKLRVNFVADTLNVSTLAVRLTLQAVIKIIGFTQYRGQRHALIVYGYEPSIVEFVRWKSDAPVVKIPAVGLLLLMNLSGNDLASVFPVPTAEELESISVGVRATEDGGVPTLTWEQEIDTELTSKDLLQLVTFLKDN